MAKQIGAHLGKYGGYWLSGVLILVVSYIMYLKLKEDVVVMQKDSKTILVVDTDNDGYADASRFTRYGNYNLIDSIKPPLPDEQEYFQKNK